MKLEPVAHIESTSLLIMLLHVDDAKRIHALGFSVRQPFPELPQVMLLEDGIYAHAFIAACQKVGILLETGTPPKSWIEGESSIFRWIHAHKWRAGDWLELCYWPHDGEMKQVTARLEPSYYIIKIRILETQNKRSVLQPYITSINSEDICRLRVLDNSEIKNHSMDQLS